jgi:phosphoglycolate phosphatase
MIIAFDLDGTISDPIVGISTSINYALEKMGFPTKVPSALGAYIGPPLQETFADLMGKNDDELIGSAITFFRERYFNIGYRENVLYPGMRGVLEQLNIDGHMLYIATSKKLEIAKAVAEYFDITKYFEDILGCGLKRKKSELLSEIKQIDANKNLVMVGDRLHDMKAGKECQYYCIGVLWGYGSKDELIGSGADMVCESPDEIVELINKIEKP